MRLFLILLLCRPALGQDITDIAPDGSCKSFIGASCSEIEFGNGRVAACLKGVKPRSEDCSAELRTFLISALKNVKTMDSKISTKCAAELTGNGVCSTQEPRLQYKCLRQNVVSKDVLSAVCTAAIRSQMAESAMDLRLDPFVGEFCSKELTDATDPVGAIFSVKPRREKLACLEDNRESVSDGCKSKVSFIPSAADIMATSTTKLTHGNLLRTFFARRSSLRERRMLQATFGLTRC